MKLYKYPVVQGRKIRPRPLNQIGVDFADDRPAFLTAFRNHDAIGIDYLAGSGGLQALINPGAIAGKPLSSSIPATIWGSRILGCCFQLFQQKVLGGL